MNTLLISSNNRKQSSSLILNPNDAYSSGVTLTNNDLSVTFDSNVGGSVRGSIGRSTGRWYFEVRITAIESGSGGYTPGIGLAPSNTNLYHPWVNGPNELLFYAYNGTTSAILFSNGQRFAYGKFVGVGDVVGIAMDFNTYNCTYYFNGVASTTFNTKTYSTATTFYPMVAGADATGSNSSLDCLFGLRQVYPLPNGYNAW